MYSNVFTLCVPVCVRAYMRACLQVVYPPLYPAMYKLFTEQESERVKLVTSHLTEQVILKFRIALLIWRCVTGLLYGYVYPRTA